MVLNLVKYSLILYCLSNWLISRPLSSNSWIHIYGTQLELWHIQKSCPFFGIGGDGFRFDFSNEVFLRRKRDVVTQ